MHLEVLEILLRDFSHDKDRNNIVIVQYNNEIIEVNIIRSKRTTACLRILPDGMVEVRGPRLMSESFVHKFVEEKADWIIQKRQEVAEHQSKKRIHTYQSGDVFLYLGKEYVLTLVAAGRKRVELVTAKEGDIDAKHRLVLYTTSFEPQKIEKQLKEWCKDQATEYIANRVAYFAQKIPGTHTGIVMENRKGRWGSCSSKGELTFNWRLILAPPEIIDYVVVHELCHLKHMDHSLAYWKAVGSILPDYKIRRAWLKDNGISLNL